MKPQNKISETPSSIDLRTVWTQDGVYKVDTISQLPSATKASYSDLLLKVRLDIVRRYAAHSNLLDICCATGQHLMSFAGEMRTGIGVDFSLPYLQKGNADKKKDISVNVGFICCDAIKIPLCSDYFDVIYSFSSLYVIPSVGAVIHEMARLLKRGGKCILDLGNLHSLNVIVANAYHKEVGLAQPHFISVRVMRQLIEESGLEIVEHRAFQILPLWGDRPIWFRVFLAPFWARLLSKQIKGKMLDEWISNFPLFKPFAFRHIFVCEKR